jgi:hypothetical protein
MRRTVAVVLVSLAGGLLVDLGTDSYYPPGVLPAFVIGVTLLLVIGSKWLGRHVVDRPVDSRPGDVDPLLADVAPPSDPHVADGPGQGEVARG